MFVNQAIVGKPLLSEMTIFATLRGHLQRTLKAGRENIAANGAEVLTVLEGANVKLFNLEKRVL